MSLSASEVGGLFPHDVDAVLAEYLVGLFGKLSASDSDSSMRSPVSASSAESSRVESFDLNPLDCFRNFSFDEHLFHVLFFVVFIILN